MASAERLRGSGPRAVIAAAGRSHAAVWVLLLLAVVGFSVMLLRHLGHPLMWQDEGETAMFAGRVLEYGYPKVHGERNVLYEFGTDQALGIDERSDAYIGTTWGHFYFAVPGALWASRSADPHERTARLRLPFALTGALGLAVLALGVVPVFGGDRKRATWFAVCFFGLSACSISLLLHLREVRYHAVLMLLTGALIAVHLRYAAFSLLSYRRYAVVVTLLLVGLFHTWYSAWFIGMAALTIDGSAATWRDRQRWRDLLPLAVSALLLVPSLVFFETFKIAAEFSRSLGLTPVVYLENLGRLLSHFARQELLIPAVVCRVAMLLRGAPARNRAVARFLVLLCGVWAAIGCLNPLVYERYFVALGPIVTALFLMDAFAWVNAGRTRGARVAIAAGLAALTLVACIPRATAVRGRIAELKTPVAGPLEFAVARIREVYPRPEELVIATNYEAHPLMYYLGSQVIVGFSYNNILEDRKRDPDLVIPRRRWRPGTADLQRFLDRGVYRVERLPIPDLWFNTVPALSPSPTIPETHRFVTPAPGEERRRLEIHHRIGTGKRVSPEAN